MGLAVGWGVAVLCVLPMIVVGGIAIVLSTQSSTWGWLLADAAFSLSRRSAKKSLFAAMDFSDLKWWSAPMARHLALPRSMPSSMQVLPGSNKASIAVSVVFSLLLSMSYLRTRALWLSWGLNFGWKAGRALIFGLAVSGVSSHSSVVEGDPMGPFWLTGGGYGLEGSWIAFFALLVAMPVVYRITRDLDFQHNAPVIIPGGIPVDLDAAARSQHEAATRPPEEPQPKPLVQILPASTPPQASRPASENSTGSGNLS